MTGYPVEQVNIATPGDAPLSVDHVTFLLLTSTGLPLLRSVSVTVQRSGWPISTLSAQPNSSLMHVTAKLRFSVNANCVEGLLLVMWFVIGNSYLATRFFVWPM